MTKKSTWGGPCATTVTIDGKRVYYSTRAEAARAHGIKPVTLSLRLKKGWSISQGLGLSKPPKNANTHRKIGSKEEGGEWPSVAEAARKHGLSTGKVHSRLHRGWTVNQALGVEPPPNRTTRGREVKIKVNGQELVFDSISAAATHFGLKPQLVLQRVNTYNWNLSQALGVAKPPKGAKVHRRIELKDAGVIYKYDSLKNAVDAYGLGYDSVKQRINKLGWTPEQAFELEAPPKHAEGCVGYIYKVTNKKSNRVYIGQTKTTVDIRWQQHAETASRNSKPGKGSLHESIKNDGLESFNCVVLDDAGSIDQLNRLERRYIKEYDTLNPAFGYNLSRGGSGLTGGKSVVVEGKKYPSFASAARAFGVSSKIAHQRMKTSRWTIEQALGISAPPKGSSGPKGIVVNQKGESRKFESQAAAAQHYGVPYKVFHSRLSLGWSVEEAVGVKVRAKTETMGSEIQVYYDGKHMVYPSIKAASTAFELKPSAVVARLANGWTPEEALGVQKRVRPLSKGTEIELRHEGKLKRYPTVSAAAAEFGLKPSTVSARLAKGWSVEQALGISSIK